jgi:hypothetical protein
MCGEEALRVMADSVAHVVLDEVGVERDAATEPAPAAVMTWARGSTMFPAAQTPKTLVRPSCRPTGACCGPPPTPRGRSRRVLGTRADPSGAQTTGGGCARVRSAACSPAGSSTATTTVTAPRGRAGGSEGVEAVDRRGDVDPEAQRLMQDRAQRGQVPSGTSWPDIG